MIIKDTLAAASIDKIDTELLLAHALNKDRSWLLAHSDTPLSSEQEQEFLGFVEQRKKHEPIAYIMNKKEFYGREFYVDERVLIPRPSTETLIDLTLDFLREPRDEVREADADIVIASHVFSKSSQDASTRTSTRGTDPNASLRSASASSTRSLSTAQHDIVIVDIGTGSGCIAITLALELPKAEIIATDVSEEALEVAKENAKRHDVLDRITFLCADTLNVQTSQPSNLLIVSNPPYIPLSEKHTLEPDVRDYEPHEALFAGEDGMDVLRPLIQAAESHPSCIGWILEMREEQAKKLASQS